MFDKEDVPFGLGAVFRPKGHRPFDDEGGYFHHPTQVPFWSVRSPFRVRFVFARCQVTAITTIHSTFTMPNTHPSGRVRRIPNVSALSQGLHTLVLLRTHALVGSMGNESHGYFTFPFFTFLLIAFMSHTRV